MDERCSTYAGYRVHQRKREEPCEPCSLAHKEYHIKYRAENLERKTQWSRFDYLLNGATLRGKSRAHRARKFGRVVEHYTEYQVIELYGVCCHVCKYAIDMTEARLTGGNGLQIDHLVPLSKGGDDILENVRPSHRICNQRKGNR